MMMTAPAVDGLSPDEQTELGLLFDVWSAKAERNSLRTQYYEGHNPTKDLGISVPPALRKVETIVGWPAKAVDVLAARSMFDGFVTAGESEDALGLRELLDANQFDFLYAQAVTAELIHSVAFITVTKGGPGDPPVLISLRSAEFASALWDYRRRRIRSGLAIVDMTQGSNPEPTVLTMYLSNCVITCERDGQGWAVVERVYNPLGRPLIEPMPFQPSERRPFGRSRITREVMSLTDQAQRGALRGDVLMEFNTAPARYLLGVDADAFKGDRWTAYMSRILTISNDENGEKPAFGQMPQLSPQGAITYMQHLASRFAGATGLPLSSLGIVQDNPASAEAMQAAKDDLVTVAHAMNRVNRIALANVARMALALDGGTTIERLPVEAASIRARFRNPALPSVVSQSDAMVKQIAAIPWLAETDVALEELGYDESQIMRLQSDRRRAGASRVLDRLDSARSATSRADSAGDVSASDVTG